MFTLETVLSEIERNMQVSKTNCDCAYTLIFFLYLNAVGLQVKRKGGQIIRFKM